MRVHLLLAGDAITFMSNITDTAVVLYARLKYIFVSRLYTEKTVLSNQQKYFIGIYATKLFFCANKTFSYINQILVT